MGVINAVWVFLALGATAIPTSDADNTESGAPNSQIIPDGEVEAAVRPGVRVSVSANNLFQFGRGDALAEPDVQSAATPLNYLTNSTEFRLGVGGFYLAARFNVDEPSRWTTGAARYREYVSRRRLGFTSDRVDISVGHFLTSFGRGLSLNLREDRALDTANILDGALLRAEVPFAEVQALVGRPERNTSDRNTMLGSDEPLFGDIVLGASFEIYPLSKVERLSELAGVSGGLSLVNYRVNVGPQVMVPVIASIVEYPVDSTTNWFDTTLKYVSWQDRTELYLPSFSIAVPFRWADLYVEHTRLYTKAYWYDSLEFLPSKFSQKPAFGTYVSLGAAHVGFSLLLEYKDYRFHHGQDPSKPNASATLAYYTDPPSARFRHSWTLLTKHEPANQVGDVRGYNATLTWTPSEQTTLTAAYNTGGPHRKTSVLAFNLDRGYWDAYLEWSQMLGDMVHTKVGFDAAKMDPAYERDRNYLGALKLMIGPFAARHGASLEVEYKLRSREYDIFDSLGSGVGTETVWTTNVLATVGYSLSPWVAAAITWERDQRPMSPPAAPRAADYLSFGITVRPTSKHCLVVEYGSFGGGSRCTMGNCFSLPPYRGLRITFTSTL